MLFLRGLRPGVRCCRQRLKCCRLLLQLQPNLKNDGRIVSEYSSNCARSELALPVEVVRKYVERIADGYERKKFVDTELSCERGYREVARLLDARVSIAESLKSLEELVQQDAEMKKLGEEEFSMYREQMDKSEDDLLEVMLSNVGREDCNNIVLEIIAGVGGQEAMLFVRNLLDMYQGHLDYLGFEHELIEADETPGAGGIRHASIAITGNRALEIFRHEGGVHRVQRIPATEKFGRVHTSTVSVAVLPQPTDIEVNLKPADLRIETKNASGAGGQHVNTTDSAVRITHVPTGISVEAQTDRSQIKNRQIAMLRLRTRIYDMQLNQQRTTSGELRKKQVGLGQRNEKIRTYNFNQDRITDHRLANGTTHNLKGFLQGGEGLQGMQEKLQRQLQIKILREAIEKVVKR